ncbi:AAA family ATPase [Methylibium sp.]|uniref:AAA family ATPase n=1 Tax=Methylibium sp. TaxID=2067992 RepID=UPI0025FE8104|nr:AAA family ATPase [Methylibium sp.]
MPAPPAGYTVVAALGSDWYRSRREADGAPILLHLQRDASSLHARKLAAHVDAAAVLLAKPLGGGPWAVHEDAGHLELIASSTLLQGGLGCDLPRWLTCARALAAALAALHRHHVAHLDIRPANAWFDGTSGQARYSGFAHARLLHYGTVAPQAGFETERLPYVSPEQTGRLALGVDHRSDLYSLGVLLFELATGRLPFKATDALEWIHSHVARRPPSPLEFAPTLPPVLADIILKLLVKAPDERYQSAAALVRDLERCQQTLDGQGRIEAFALALGDMRQTLEISPALIGRERELAALRAALQEAHGGAAPVVVVFGFSGIGKSVLVRGAAAGSVLLLVEGKFDQYQRDTPYATLVQAFRAQLRHVLGQDDVSLQAWRARLRDALGSNGKVIAEVVPDLELVLGAQSPVPELGPAEARNRFSMVFSRFVQAFATRDRPLLLFLDDMQWADSATLELLQRLTVGSELRHVCLVLAYRDNEVDAQHPLRTLLTQLDAGGVVPRHTELGPLGLEGISEHLAASLSRSPHAVRPLARLVLQKTGGNPFFVNEFLKTLYEKRLLAPDASTGGWAWDLACIEAEDITDNLIDLLVDRLGILSPATQEALTLTAAFGNQVELERLATLLRQPIPVTVGVIAPASSMGLVTWLHGADTPTLRFAHDRIQQAAYSLTPAAARAALHLRIGRLLLGDASEQLDEAVLFDVVNQLNAGVALIDHPDERDRLGWLNAAAGRRAMKAVAYDSALRYFDAADLLLNLPAADYTSSFTLQRDHAECQFLAGRLVIAEASFERLVALARNDIDRAAVYYLWVRLQQVAGDFRRALELGLQALAFLGIAPPESTPELAQAVIQERRAIDAWVTGHSIPAVAQLPTTSDAHARATISMLTTLGPPTYLAKPDLFPLLVSKAVNLSLQHGNCEDSCFAYSMYSMLLVSSFGDVPAGFEFSHMSISLNERFADPKLKGTVLHIHGSHINSWRNPFPTSFSFLERGFAACVEAGDLTVASYNGFQGSWQYIMAAARLPDADPVLDKYLDFARRIGQRPVWLTIRAQRQLQRALQGLTAEEGLLDGEGFDTAAALEDIEAGAFKSGTAHVHMARLVLALTFGDFATAHAAATHAALALDAVSSLPIEADFHFYRALALAATADDAHGLDSESLAAMEQDIQRLHDWARHGPANFEHRHVLLTAEQARLAGDARSAMGLYERAAALAIDHGALRDAALSCETAARFYMTSGANSAGRTALRAAAGHYREWGAFGKQRQIERSLGPEPVQTAGRKETPDLLAESVDLLSLTKAMQAISGEIDRDRLLQTLMRNVLEQAGAQSAQLVLCEPTGDKVVIGSSAGDDPPPGGTAADLPQSLIAYVKRSRDPVVLHDAGDRHRFSADPAWAPRQARSVLCLPIGKQADLLGLLYLENNLAPGAFSPDRILTLEVLAGQIAISLDNSRLYAEVVASTERLDQAVAAAELAVWTWHLDSGHVASNPTMARLYGRTVTSLDEAMATVHPDDRAPVQATLDQVVIGSVNEFTLEHRVLHPNGTVREVEARGSITRRNSAGRAITMSGVTHDITERNQALKRRQALLVEQAARAEADAGNRAKDAFLATLAHELRNPLAPIVTGLQLLERGADAPAVARLAPMMRRHATHMVRLVDDLLEVSRLTHGKIELQRRRIDLADVAQGALEAVQPLMEERRHVLRVQGPAPGTLWLDADPVRLGQVLANLLNNAAKFTPPGGHITLAVQPKAQSVLISVRDDGQGIPATLLPRVFDMFAQGEPDLASAASIGRGGLGIGLSLVRGLVELHGGEVTVTSEGPGCGSEFVVQLPLAMSSAAAPVAAVASAEAAAPAAGLHVLLVDDNRDAADSLGEMIKLLGAEARAVYDGPSALAAIEAQPPTLAFIDIGMPGMDGHELARRIRAQPRHAAMTLVALTGWGQAQDRERTRAAGFDDHLVKPVEIDTLQAILGREAPT